MSGATSGPGPGSEEDLDILAAEYALGVLAPQEMRALEALSFINPAVASSIAAWEDRLAPLVGVVAPITPPPTLWRRLALATGIEAQVVPLQRPAERRAARAGPWQAMTAGAVAIAASLAFLLYTQPVPTAPLVAALTPYNSPGATFLVRVGNDGVATVTALGDTGVPQGRALELWALRPAATVPVSLGLLPSSGRARLTIQQPADTQLLVSQEPPGGSPTKLPTGPVVYQGKLSGT